MDRVGIAVIGAGYWGPNLVRNTAFNPSTDLRWVCDIQTASAERLASTFAGARATSDLRQVLDDPDVHAVAIATPAATHAELAIEALTAGKHVLIEKPIAASVGEAEKMIAVAADEGLTLMCDHTYCYSPSVRHIRSVIEQGDLGDILFVDSVRINLGLVQSDVNVLWDLAPHDLSILDHVLPDRAGRDGGCRHRFRPDRCRSGMRRPPFARPARRQFGTRPRQLAQPDQGSYDDHRWNRPHPRVGRLESHAAHQHLRPRRRSRIGSRRRGAIGAASPTGSAT